MGRRLFHLHEKCSPWLRSQAGPRVRGVMAAGKAVEIGGEGLPAGLVCSELKLAPRGEVKSVVGVARGGSRPVVVDGGSALPGATRQITAQELQLRGAFAPRVGGREALQRLPRVG